MQQHAGNPMIERVLRERFGCVWLRAEAFGSYQCPAEPHPKLLPSSVSQYDTGAHLEETSDGSVFLLEALALGRPGGFQIAVGYNGMIRIDFCIVEQRDSYFLQTPNHLTGRCTRAKGNASAGLD